MWTTSVIQEMLSLQMVSRNTHSSSHPALSLHAHRKLHGERQELIRQWDEAMDAMKQRDGAILVGALMHFDAGTCNGAKTCQS